MEKPTTWLRAAATAALLLALAPAARAQGIASVTQFKGDVSVAEASGGERPLTLIPNTDRIANGMLADGDELRTGAGAEAVVQAADGSTVRLLASTRLTLSESPVSESKPAGERRARRQLRLAEGRIVCDIRSSDAVQTSLAAPAAFVSIPGAQFSAAAANGRLLLAVDNGRAVVRDRTGYVTFPVGAEQEIRFQQDGNVLTVRLDGDGGRPVTGTIRTVRVELTKGDAIRVAGGAEGPLSVTVVAGPVQVIRSTGGAVHTAQTGETFPAQAEGEAAAEPAAEPAPKPAVRPVVRRGQTARAPTEAEGPPPLPTVPAVDDTVESSPTK